MHGPQGIALTLAVVPECDGIAVGTGRKDLVRHAVCPK